jgi:hypothetical protein
MHPFGFTIDKHEKLPSRCFSKPQNLNYMANLRWGETGHNQPLLSGFSGGEHISNYKNPKEGSLSLFHHALQCMSSSRYRQFYLSNTHIPPSSLPARLLLRVFHRLLAPLLLFSGGLTDQRRSRRGNRPLHSSSKLSRSMVWSRVQAYSLFGTFPVEIWWPMLFGSAGQLVVVLFLLAVLQQVELGEQCRLYPSRPPCRISSRSLKSRNICWSMSPFFPSW